MRNVEYVLYTKDVKGKMYKYEECKVFVHTRNCAFILCMCERHNIVVVGSCVYACVCRFVMILFNQGLNYYLLSVHLDKFQNLFGWIQYSS